MTFRSPSFCGSVRRTDSVSSPTALERVADVVHRIEGREVFKQGVAQRPGVETVPRRSAIRALGLSPFHVTTLRPRPRYEPLSLPIVAVGIVLSGFAAILRAPFHRCGAHRPRGGPMRRVIVACLLMAAVAAPAALGADPRRGLQERREVLQGVPRVEGGRGLRRASRHQREQEERVRQVRLEDGQEQGGGA